MKVTALDGTEGIKYRIKKGTKPWHYKGWRYAQSRKDGEKYIQLFRPSWPTCDKNGYIREHRYIMECYLGRNLLKTEVVHHKDGNTLNNDITNLEVMSKIEHDKMNTYLNIHRRWMAKGGSAQSHHGIKHNPAT